MNQPAELPWGVVGFVQKWSSLHKQKQLNSHILPASIHPTSINKKKKKKS